MQRTQPMQPIEVVDGVVRFRRNHLVRYLLDQKGGVNLNNLAMLPNIPAEDRMQLAQLIGYSVSGYGDLNYASKKSIAEVDKIAAKLLSKRNAKS